MSELPEKYVFRIEKKINIEAPAMVAWQAVLEQMGPGMDRPDGELMPMTLEAWPGGRWYRDLGDNAGHFWGHVQVIKPGRLIEICGPMFMSYAAVSHLQYKLDEKNGTTTLSLIHRVLGEMDAQHRAGVDMGWDHQLKRMKERASK
jgi:hypothetical protein